MNIPSRWFRFSPWMLIFFGAIVLLWLPQLPIYYRYYHRPPPNTYPVFLLWPVEAAIRLIVYGLLLFVCFWLWRKQARKTGRIEKSQ
jgi:hypothetical protein